jgi:hypothetical protein
MKRSLVTDQRLIIEDNTRADCAMIVSLRSYERSAVRKIEETRIA